MKPVDSSPRETLFSARGGGRPSTIKVLVGRRAEGQGLLTITA
jgi:hypothetical protein